MTTKEIDNNIESMLISKVAHYRLSVRELFRQRHNVAWPDLAQKELKSKIKRLRVWQRIAELIQPTHNPPYTTYLAKQLTHDNARP